MQLFERFKFSCAVLFSCEINQTKAILLWTWVLSGVQSTSWSYCGSQPLIGCKLTAFPNISMKITAPLLLMKYFISHCHLQPTYVVLNDFLKWTGKDWPFVGWNMETVNLVKEIIWSSQVIKAVVTIHLGTCKLHFCCSIRYQKRPVTIF